MNDHIIRTAAKITLAVKNPLPKWMKTSAICNKKTIGQKHEDSKVDTKKLVKRDDTNYHKILFFLSINEIYNYRVLGLRISLT